MISFHVGQKVVCVRDNWEDRIGRLGIVAPIAGHQYVIRSIWFGVSIRLHWLINPPHEFVEGFAEPAFSILGNDGVPNFRPVIERSTDISIFQKLLIPSPCKETA